MLDERKRLAREGIVVVVVTVNRQTGGLLKPPEATSYGFAEGESQGLMETAAEEAQAALDRRSKDRLDWDLMTTKVSDSVSNFMYRETGRRPTVLAHINQV